MIALLLLALAQYDELPGDKLIVVRVPSEDATFGTLERFERAQKKWKSIAPPIRVVVGKKGVAKLGKKREGDLKTPAGTFKLIAATGYDPTPPKGTTLPYRQAGDSLKCVDDSKSKYYNRVVDEKEIAKDWTSAEDMRLADDRYRRVLIVDYNTSPTTPGDGSCIFIHPWRNAEAATAGCIAMPLADVESLMRWADNETRVVITAGPTSSPAARRSPGSNPRP